MVTGLASDVLLQRDQGRDIICQCPGGASCTGDPEVVDVFFSSNHWICW